MCDGAVTLSLELEPAFLPVVLLQFPRRHSVRCAASEPIFEKSFECPACGKKSLKFEFAGMWH
jgi:rRNA maturation endonuclease Nob1